MYTPGRASPKHLNSGPSHAQLWTPVRSQENNQPEFIGPCSTTIRSLYYFKLINQSLNNQNIRFFHYKFRD